MRNIDCILTEYLPSFIAEGSPLKEYEAGSRQFEWTDDEFAAIRAVLRRLTAIRIINSNDAEDLVQETLLTMIAKRPREVLEKGPLVWSLGILRKKVGNYYRKVQRYSSLSEGESRGCEWKHAASPEARIFHEELQAIVDEVISQLPSPQRKALELMIEGCNAGEIVKELHPERYQTVISRLYRGRKKLVKELAKYGYRPHATAGMRKMKRCRRKEGG